MSPVFNPDATLAEFRAALRRWQEALVTDSAAPDPNSAYAAAIDCLQAARLLDKNLSRGGTLPSAWSPQPSPASPIPLPGSRVEITGQLANDPDPLPIGSRGTVTGGAPNVGQIFVNWDNGRRLILLASDPYRVLGPNEDVTPPS